MADNTSHYGGGAIHAATDVDIIIRNRILWNTYDNGVLHEDVEESSFHGLGQIPFIE